MAKLYIMLGLILSYSSCWAVESVCALSQIVNGVPKFWVNKMVSKDHPVEMVTTDGVFTGRITYQADLDGWSLLIRSSGPSAAGFFEGSAKAPVLTLNTDGTKAQINCSLN